MKTLQNFPYKRVLVLGLAKSGEAAARILFEHGKNVIVNDIKRLDENPIAKQLKQMGIEVITGSHPLHVLDNVEVVVKNPGIPYDNVIVSEAQKRNIPIVTEIELAGLLAEGPIIGITGSNGKTTTTTLIHEMLQESGIKARLAGNIGMVASEVAQTTTKDEVLVMELSSFQLLGTEQFHPKVSVFLNLYEAHLDYHKTMDHYANAKAKIFANQTEGDYIVYNQDDSKVRTMVTNATAEKVPFSSKERMNRGAFFDGNTLYYDETPIVNIDEVKMVGQHQYENMLAAIAASVVSGARLDAIRNVLRRFNGVSHRLQFVRSINNRKFYNDSKATNILATTKALSAFDAPVILLAGGLDRGNDFDPIIPSLQQVKAVVLFGQTAPKLAEAAKKAGIREIIYVNNVKQAVNEAYAISSEHDVILLSPACASWDQYTSFEERGDMFMDEVHKL
ncbi:UDP-N-acetylmuramoyl-L-alanine--D-glutamate ligase [Salirhabdus salicampi]|uniref:UDP-N-acetylmuramoyl-L-alanine--D-glutamate ligase n=1 Tax=Salirhabdus salicampi TaxID=476102 RepID=UPI0020C3023B|nr:UDP-N-acetylmuramoyl-L-alanine--D-glutamate ligase [Salirhabdus salicampi]